MYKVEIDLGGWNETITIETNDFNKIALLAEFVEFQQECNWCKDEELTFVDEDGITWVYDEDLDEWVEVEEEEDENQE